jgi:hypothetical protein
MDQQPQRPQLLQFLTTDELSQNILACQRIRHLQVGAELDRFIYHNFVL